MSISHKTLSDAVSSWIEENSHYKLRLGPFSTQLKAEKNLIEIRKEYPKAFIVPHQYL